MLGVALVACETLSSLSMCGSNDFKDNGASGGVDGDAGEELGFGDVAVMFLSTDATSLPCSFISVSTSSSCRAPAIIGSGCMSYSDLPTKGWNGAPMHQS